MLIGKPARFGRGDAYQTIITMPPMPSEFLTQPPSQTRSTQTGWDTENENLLAGLPNGFKIGYQAGRYGNQTITEMVSEDETVRLDDHAHCASLSGRKNTTPQQAQETPVIVGSAHVKTAKRTP
ncbi:MAG: hypothetical protein U0X92_12945 [Anaerolineales bacterium]